MAKKYLSLEEAAAQLGMSTEELNRRRESGDLRGFADRGNWKFRPEDVEKFSREQQADSHPAVPILSPGQVSDDDLGDSGVILVGDDSGLFDNVDSSISDDGKKTIPPASDSDVQLVAPDSDSDVRLVGEDSESDVQLLSADSDSDVQLIGDDSQSDVQLISDNAATINMGTEKELQITDSTIAEDVASDSDVQLIDGDAEKTAETFAIVDKKTGAEEPDSGISLEPLPDSGIALEGTEDDSGITLEPDLDSGIALEPDMDSGIALVAEESSGISLSEPDDSGIALEALMDDSGDFQKTMAMDKVPAAGGDNFDATQLDVVSLDDDDDDFELGGSTGSASGSGGTGSIVFDDDSDFGTMPVPLDDGSQESEFDDDLDVVDDDFGDDDEIDDIFGADDDDFSDDFAGESAADFVAPGRRVAVEQQVDWGAGTFVGLLFTSGLMILCSVIMFDFVRSMWSWSQPNAFSSSLLKTLGSFFSK